MTGLDAKFLYSETPTAHMHTVKVAVADVSDIEGGFTFEEFVEVLGVQLDHLPPFRRRAVPVPGRLGHPVWVEDPDFELHRHVGRMVLPAPGDKAQLAAVVGEFASLPLKRDRPLWELLFVEGLAGGRMAVVVKLHHAVADGTAVVALLHSVVRGMSEEPPDEHQEDPWRPEPIPDRRQLLKMAYRDHVTRWKGMPRLVGRSVRGAKASELRRRSFPVRPPLPLHRVPRTSLNVSLTAERTFAMTTLPMEELKAIRRAAGTTLNDVYLAVCAGAIRRYLEARGELPARSLLASVPVSTDPNVARLQGNRVDNLYVSIGTDLADPAERLAHINEVTKAAKEVRSVLGHDLFAQRADVVPPTSTARSIERVDAQPRRQPASPAAQRRAVQRGRAARADLLRPDPARVPLLGGAHPRGDRPQHHRLELRGRPRGLGARLPGQPPRPLADRRRAARRPRRAEGGGRPPGPGRSVSLPG